MAEARTEAADIGKVDRNLIILVVDDQAATRETVRTILKGLGFYHVSAVEDGRVALERLERENVGLVICDWRMPYISGLDVLKAVRAKSETAGLPFIMLTAEGSPDKVKLAIAAGVSDYIVKPFTPQVLAEKIASVMQKGN